MRAALASLLLFTLLVSAAQAAPESVFVVADRSPAARAWSRIRDLLWLTEQAVAMIVPAVLLFSRLGARLRTGLDRLTRGRRLLTASLFAGGYAVLALVAKLPVSAARQLLAEPFGLTTADWPAWASAQAQSAWPIVAAAFLLGWAPYLLFARSPRYWPLWAAGLMVTTAAVVLATQPSWHDLRPVTDPELRATISRLAARAGEPDVRTAVRKAERAEPCGSATVVGLGPTKVLVLDTGLLRHHSPREVAQTVAHELKHYAQDDDLKALYAIAVLTACALAVLFLGSEFLLPRSGGRLGFTELADPASLPLLALILTLYGLVASAGFHAYGRGVEREADRFSLELTQDRAAQAVQMQRYLACSRLKDPDLSWIQQTFRQNHPSLRARIAFAEAYRPRRSGVR